VTADKLTMPDVLIRGLSAAAVERIDAEAAALGLPRTESPALLAI